MGDDVGGEAVQRERGQRPCRPGQFTGEGEHDQTEQQRQRDHGEAGPQHQPPRIVARLVEQVPAQPALVSGEGGVDARIREGHPGADDQLAERRMLGIVAQPVLVRVLGGRAHVDRLVDGRGLPHGGRDHREGHLREQHDHQERHRPPSGRPTRGPRR